jgi:8-oxo-dGTP pyrophosphatase MutT (NUDIX family)
LTDPGPLDSERLGTEPVRVPAPGWLAEHAARFRDSGQAPATPRNAATVILMRPTGEGFEVYLQRRASTMAFAPNMYAFPGGSVDPRDAAGAVGWTGPPPSWWAGRLGLPEPDARAVVCAAVREVFEECGVLLAGPDESTVVGDVSGPEWEAARVALLGREAALVDVLGDRGLAVRSDLLAPWARWLTPEFEPRRFDTFFFLARLPADQSTRDVGGESEHSAWLAPAEAARLPMLPPTKYTLGELAGTSGVEAATRASAGREVSRPVRPQIEVDPDGSAWLALG